MKNGPIMARINRRHFLLGAAGLAAGVAGLRIAGAALDTPKIIAGGIVGANAQAGHRLRTGDFPSVTEAHQHDVVIIGGGIAGLSAAWKLQQAGVKNYRVLELEDTMGGTSQSGSNAVSAYPWGAHYVPLLTQEATAAQELFQELGIIIGMQDGWPLYNEYHLCADVHERLYMAGRWQEGLVPQLGLTTTNRAQYEAFFTRMEYYKNRRGSDGKRAFAIPLAYSSTDTELRALDKISMADYMNQQGWNAKPLRWYVDYCCRDDFGAPSTAVSAWAGIHYFAARNGRSANAETQDVLTWPAGNGWIVQQLQQKLRGTLSTQQLVYAVETTAKGVEVTCLDLHRNISQRFNARAAILAVPQFVAQHLLKTSASAAPIPAPHYSPWLVANITVNIMPQGKGTRLAWDNVIYDSTLLGYVVATHQNLNRVQHETVLTYYWPLDQHTPAIARQNALARPYTEWQETILAELFRIHPELKEAVQRVDIWLWGHGMIRPVPDYIWNTARLADTPSPPVFMAHSDMSGIAIFEEANYHGVRAAENLLTFLGQPFRSSL
jgi:predicted NAD/FAD-dependent oxidoreductase